MALPLNKRLSVLEEAACELLRIGGMGATPGGFGYLKSVFDKNLDELHALVRPIRSVSTPVKLAGFHSASMHEAAFRVAFEIILVVSTACYRHEHEVIHISRTPFTTLHPLPYPEIGQLVEFYNRHFKVLEPLIQPLCEFDWEQASVIVRHESALAGNSRDESYDDVPESIDPLSSVSNDSSANVARLFPKGVPGDPNIVDLVVRLNAEKDGDRSMNEIAREYFQETIGNEPKSKRALARIRMMRNRGRVNL